MRFPVTASILALSLTLASPSYAMSEWYRLNLQAPILFTGADTPAGETDDNPAISITIDDSSMLDDVVRQRDAGYLNVSIHVDGIDTAHSVNIVDRPAGSTWVPDTDVHGYGEFIWDGALIGSYAPIIEVRDSNGELLIAQTLDITIYPHLAASVPQNTYEVAKGDDLAIEASSDNAIGGIVWSTPSPLPEWLSLDAAAGVIDVDTDQANTAGSIQLYATDQFDHATTSTFPFSITVNGAVTDHWVATIGASLNDQGYDVAAGPDGSVYVLGYTNSSIGGGGSYDLILIKYDSSGEPLWRESLGGTGNEYAYGVAAGPDGSVYVTGFTSSVQAGNNDIWVAKYGANGELSWKKALTGSGNDRGEAITVASDGSVYVVGHNVVGSSNNNLFLAKYTPNGTLSWQKMLGKSGNEYGHGVTVSADNSVYVTGYHTVISGDDDLLIAKYNENGELSWVQTLGGTRYEAGYGIAAGSDGSLYIVGYATETSTSNTDLLIAAYTNNGELSWARTLGGSLGEEGHGIAVGSDGSVYVTGRTYSSGSPDVMVAKYTSSGNLSWQKALASSNNDFGEGIVVGSNGAIYLTGRTQATIQGGFDLLVARLPSYDSDDMTAGAFTWRNTTLTEKDASTLPIHSPSWDNVDANLGDAQNLTGFVEGNAATLSGSVIQFQ